MVYSTCVRKTNMAKEGNYLKALLKKGLKISPEKCQLLAKHYNS